MATTITKDNINCLGWQRTEDYIGGLTNLKTKVRSSVVKAINELHDRIENYDGSSTSSLVGVSKTINVVEYGMYNDGTHGETNTRLFAEILAAHSECEILFPSGKYYFTNYTDDDGGNHAPSFITTEAHIRFNNAKIMVNPTSQIGYFLRVRGKMMNDKDGVVEQPINNMYIVGPGTIDGGGKTRNLIEVGCQRGMLIEGLRLEEFTYIAINHGYSGWDTDYAYDGEETRMTYELNIKACEIYNYLIASGTYGIRLLGDSIVQDIIFRNTQVGMQISGGGNLIGNIHYWAFDYTYKNKNAINNTIMFRVGGQRNQISNIYDDTSAVGFLICSNDTFLNVNNVISYFNGKTLNTATFQHYLFKVQDGIDHRTLHINGVNFALCGSKNASNKNACAFAQEIPGTDFLPNCVFDNVNTLNIDKAPANRYTKSEMDNIFSKNQDLMYVDDGAGFNYKYKYFGTGAFYQEPIDLDLNTQYLEFYVDVTTSKMSGENLFSVGNSIVGWANQDENFVELGNNFVQLHSFYTPASKNLLLDFICVADVANRTQEQNLCKLNGIHVNVTVPDTNLVKVRLTKDKAYFNNEEIVFDTVNNYYGDTIPNYYQYWAGQLNKAAKAGTLVAGSNLKENPSYAEVIYTKVANIGEEVPPSTQLRDVKRYMLQDTKSEGTSWSATTFANLEEDDSKITAFIDISDYKQEGNHYGDISQILAVGDSSGFSSTDTSKTTVQVFTKSTLGRFRVVVTGGGTTTTMDIEDMYNYNEEYTFQIGKDGIFLNGYEYGFEKFESQTIAENIFTNLIPALDEVQVGYGFNGASYVQYNEVIYHRMEMVDIPEEELALIIDSFGDMKKYCDKNSNSIYQYRQPISAATIELVKNTSFYTKTVDSSLTFAISEPEVDSNYNVTFELELNVTTNGLTIGYPWDWIDENQAPDLGVAGCYTIAVRGKKRGDNWVWRANLQDTEEAF